MSTHTSITGSLALVFLGLIAALFVVWNDLSGELETMGADVKVLRIATSTDASMEKLEEIIVRLGLSEAAQPTRHPNRGLTEEELFQFGVMVEAATRRHDIDAGNTAAEITRLTVTGNQYMIRLRDALFDVNGRLVQHKGSEVPVCMFGVFVYGSEGQRSFIAPDYDAGQPPPELEMKFFCDGVFVELPPDNAEIVNPVALQWLDDIVEEAAQSEALKEADSNGVD